MSEVLDVCCGPRMFWFDQDDPRTVFCDLRNEDHVVPDRSYESGVRAFQVRPNIQADFTALPFTDQSFNVVVFDPPHFKRNGQQSWIGKKYGTLPGNWRDLIRGGFAECFRVLRQGGTLVFKWNESEVSVQEILALAPCKPLIGNRFGKTQQSHFLVFVKL